MLRFGLNYKSSADSSTATDLPEYLGPNIRDILQLSRGLSPDKIKQMEPEEIIRLAQGIEQGNRNVSMSARLKALGGSPEAAMKPAIDKPKDPSTVSRIFNLLDVAGAPVRYGIAKAQGAPLYNKSPWGGNGKSKVSGSDIIRYLQDTALGGSTDTAGQRWSRGVGGLATGIATDPVTWLSFGTGAAPKIGGKALSKEGINVLKEAAPLFNQTKNKTEAMKTVKSAIEAAAQRGEQVYETAGTRMFGQKIAPDPFNLIGKGLKKGYGALKEYANPVGAETYGIGRRLAGDVVDTIDDLGKAVSTKFGLPDEYLAMRRTFEDTISSSRQTIKQELRSIFTKPDGTIASKKERIAIARHIDDPKNFTISADLKPVAGAIKKKFSALATDLQSEGLLGGTIENYMAHIIGKDLPKHLRTTNYGGRLSATLSGHQKNRFYKTFAELHGAQTGLKSVTELDSAKILGNYWAIAERAKATKRFLGDVESLSQTTKIGDKALRTQFQEKIGRNLADFTTSQMESNSQFVKAVKDKSGKIIEPERITTIISPKTIKDLPKSVVDDLNRIENPKYVKGFPGYRSAHNAWKTMVTVPNLGFHMRNFGSNQVLSFLNVGKEMLNPKLYWDVGKVLTGGKGKVITRHGLEYSYDDIRRLAQENGVLRGDWGKDVVGEFPNLASRLNLMNVARKLGGTVENEGRMTNFIAHLNRGDSPLEAAKYVDEALFNYSDLSNADRAIKWVIPFWTFMSRHAKLTAKTLVTNPGRITAEIRLGKDIGGAILPGQELSEVDLKALPEFYQEGLKIAKSTDNGTRTEILSGLGLPIEDLENYPIFAGWQRFVEKGLAGRASPLLKLPLELWLNNEGRDFFFGAPLKPGSAIRRPDGTMAYPYTKSYPLLERLPEPVKAWLEYEELPTVKKGEKRYTLNPYKLKELEFWTIAISGLIPKIATPFIFSRYYRDLGKLSDASQSKTGRILDFATGVKTYDLEGAADLKTRAAQRRTGQVGNLLMDALSKEKKRQGIID